MTKSLGVLFDVNSMQFLQIRLFMCFLLLCGVIACAEKRPEGLNIPDDDTPVGQNPVVDPNELDPAIRVLFPIPNSNIGANADTTSLIKVEVVDEVVVEDVTSVTAEGVALTESSNYFWQGQISIPKGEGFITVEVRTASGKTYTSKQAIDNGLKPFAGATPGNYGAFGIDVDSQSHKLFLSDVGNAVVVEVDLFNGNRKVVYKGEVQANFTDKTSWAIDYVEEEKCYLSCRRL